MFLARLFKGICYTRPLKPASHLQKSKGTQHCKVEEPLQQLMAQYDQPYHSRPETRNYTSGFNAPPKYFSLEFGILLFSLSQIARSAWWLLSVASQTRSSYQFIFNSPASNSIEHLPCWWLMQDSKR